MIKWTKQSKTTDEDGTRIVYDGEGTDFVIISDKRHIPHANREGFWDHTIYILHDIVDSRTEVFQTMKEAKAFAEKLLEEGNNAEV